jgi:collagenase-like PrtC family protease
VIEVGAQAFRLSGEEQDRATVAQDANAYLARPDAAQTERVRTILTTLAR